MPFSRWRERLADEYALQSTGNPQAFASAFVRLANQNLGEVDPEKWVVFMFYDHPPLGERIKMASRGRRELIQAPTKALDHKLVEQHIDTRRCRCSRSARSTLRHRLCR